MHFSQKMLLFLIKCQRLQEEEQSVCKSLCLKFWMRTSPPLLCPPRHTFLAPSWKKHPILEMSPNPWPRDLPMHLGLSRGGAKTALPQNPGIPSSSAQCTWEHKSHPPNDLNSWVCEFDGTFHKRAGFLGLPYFHLMLDCCSGLVQSTPNIPNRRVCHKWIKAGPKKDLGNIDHKKYSGKPLCCFCGQHFTAPFCTLISEQVSAHLLWNQRDSGVSL